MTKRPHEDGAGSEGSPLIILKRLEPDHNHMAFTSFNLVADLMFGHYLKNTHTLIAFAIPPPDKNVFIRAYFKKKFKVPFEPSKIPPGVNKIMDVYNNVNEYNLAFYLTQRREFVCRMSVEEVGAFNTTRYDEVDLIKGMFSPNLFTFNVIYPLYNRGLVDSIKYGAYVLTSVMDYLKTGDRSHVDMGDKDKCTALLRDCVGYGMARDVGDFHPPLPTAPRFQGSVQHVRNIYQLGTTNFATIARMYDTRRDEFEDWEPDAPPQEFYH